MTDEPRPSRGGRRRRRRLRGVVPRAARGDRRGRALDLRRQGVVDPPARRGDRGARLRGRRRRGRGHAPRHALPRRHGHRRLGPRDADAARHRGRAERSALRERRRRGHGLRAEGPHGGSAPPRRARARRPLGARPARAVRSSASRRWSCSGCSRTRPRSPSTCSSRRGRRSGCSTDGERRARGRRAPRGGRRRARGRAARGRASSCSTTSPARSARGSRTKEARAAVHPARASKDLLPRGATRPRPSREPSTRALDGAHPEPVSLDVGLVVVPRRAPSAVGTLSAVPSSEPWASTSSSLGALVRHLLLLLGRSIARF